MKSLSKSNLLKGYQCKKALYLTVHKPDLASPPTPAQEFVFKQGHEVGEKALENYPKGVMIDAPPRDLKLALTQTKQSIESKVQAIFEATFSHNGAHCKVDILERLPGNKFNIREVKSTTGVKDQHVLDCTIQTYIVQGSGIKVKDAYLTHLNRECVYPDLSNLFHSEPLTSDVTQRLEEFESDLEGFKKILRKKSTPKVEIGRHCDSPYECPFKAHCWKDFPKEGTVFDLPSSWKLFEKGFHTIEDLKGSEDELKGAEARAYECVSKNKRFIEPEKILKKLETFKYPRHYLDFESFAPAIPKFENSRPYEQIPFQFSLHIEEKKGTLTHHEFLHDQNSDPREALLNRLVESIGKDGSIISYNAAFEKAVLKSLAALFPKRKDVIDSWLPRFVDPLPLIKAHLYDPKFKGSFSLKYVAPALLGQDASYLGMEVSDGMAAGQAFFEIIDPLTDSERREGLRKALLSYCEKDTVVLKRVVDKLSDFANIPS